MPPFNEQGVQTVAVYKVCRTEVSGKKVYQLINKSYLNYHLPVLRKITICTRFNYTLSILCSLKFYT